ncbi:luciferin 4-monooxygenase-like [Belonocnema kinseyi]|uniref:luciferin 4-monooxygenase-like n=1 Tax=Belonocnema kinseyi TaxID=2817044 RepID=UPI00143DD7DC|nr:luciferin 4-monooxygenase-like [Belonocnema kinseyi]
MELPVLAINPLIRGISRCFWSPYSPQMGYLEETIEEELPDIDVFDISENRDLNTPVPTTSGNHDFDTSVSKKAVIMNDVILTEENRIKLPHRRMREPSIEIDGEQEQYRKPQEGGNTTEEDQFFEKFCEWKENPVTNDRVKIKSNAEGWLVEEFKDKKLTIVRLIFGDPTYTLLEKEILLEMIQYLSNQYPDTGFHIDCKTGETSTYKKLAEESIRCAIWLKKQGIESGDVVVICSENNIASWAPFCAVFYLAANLNPWYHDWSPDTLRYLLNLMKPKIMFANEKSGRILNEIIKEEKELDMKIVIFGKVDGLVSFDDIINEQSPDEVEQFECQSTNPDDDCLVLLTSGSIGGLSKAIQHTYEGTFYICCTFNTLFTKAEGMPSMCPSPMYWITAVFHIIRCLLTISPAIIIRDSTPEELCRVIEKYKINLMLLASEILKDLSQSQVLEKYDLSSVKSLIFGGTKPSVEVMKNINDKLVNAAINQMYGCTELGVAILQLNDEKGNINYNSSGVVLPGVEMKVVDVNTGELLGPNQEGELHFKAKGMMKGYFTNSTTTEEVIKSDGWFHTGDLGYYDKKGCVYYVCRINDIIKFRGHQITPLEIEEVLLKHPDILEAAVVSVPHLLDTEHPIAFVTKAQHSEAISLISIYLNVLYNSSIRWV